MQQNTIKRINDILAEGIRTRGNDATLEELLGLTDAANGALGDLLGAFTNTNNLKALLGDLHPTTKQLGNILGGFGHTENLKDILGDLTTTKNLGGILGAFSAAQNLKAILGDLTNTKNLGGILGGFTTTNNLKTLLGLLTSTNNLFDVLGGYTAAASLKADVDIIVADTPYIHDAPVSTPTADSIADIVQRVLNATDMALRPTIPLDESWQREAVPIDPAVWATLLTGTGAVVRSAAEPPYLKVILNSAAINDTASLHSANRWFCGPDTYGTNTILQRLVLEFEAKLVNTPSLLNTAFFMGLAATQGAYETTNDLIGIVLGDDDKLESITDDGGAETKKTLVAAGFAGWHKYKIDAYAGTVDFYVDEVKLTTHTTADVEHLPDAAMYVNFYCPAEGALFNGELHVGRTRLMTEDIVR